MIARVSKLSYLYRSEYLLLLYLSMQVRLFIIGLSIYESQGFYFWPNNLNRSITIYLADSCNVYFLIHIYVFVHMMNK